MLFVYCLNKTFLTDDIWTFCLISLFFFLSIKFFSKSNCREMRQTDSSGKWSLFFRLRICGFRKELPPCCCWPQFLTETWRLRSLSNFQLTFVSLQRLQSSGGKWVSVIEVLSGGSCVRKKIEAHYVFPPATGPKWFLNYHDLFKSNPMFSLHEWKRNPACADFSWNYVPVWACHNFSCQ